MVLKVTGIKKYMLLTYVHQKEGMTTVMTKKTKLHYFLTLLAFYLHLNHAKPHQPGNPCIATRYKGRNKGRIKKNLRGGKSQCSTDKYQEKKQKSLGY